MSYKEQIKHELNFWQFELMKKPGVLDHVTTKIQSKINSYIPQKIHDAVTVTIKQMVKAVLFGSTYTSSSMSHPSLSLMHREALVKSKIDNYGKTGAAEGGVTGAGGFLLSLADFPILIGIKLKLLFEIASLYGYDVKDYKERIYILHIFQLAFSSKKGGQKVYKAIEDWDDKIAKLPPNAQDFDWQTFQIEYRDYIDLAKLAQLLPVVGAAVGAIANYQLIKKLGKTAMMCYRMRQLQAQQRIISFE